MRVKLAFERCDKSDQKRIVASNGGDSDFVSSQSKEQKRTLYSEEDGESDRREG